MCQRIICCVHLCPPSVWQKIVRLTQETPPHEATHWTARAMAKAVGLAVSTVQSIWRAHGLAPHRWRSFKLSSDPAFAETAAFRNGTLQGGYLILAARALGLDVGPVQGFDEDAVDALYFAGTAVHTNFLCNLGYGDVASLPAKPLRLSFAQAARIV